MTDCFADARNDFSIDARNDGADVKVIARDEVSKQSLTYESLC